MTALIIWQVMTGLPALAVALALVTVVAREREWV
jgi:hypothetical protein